MRKKYGLIGLLVLVFSLVAPVGAPFFAAQSSIAAPVSSIVIEGAQRVDRETVLSYLQFTQGQEATPARIDESLKALSLFSENDLKSGKCSRLSALSRKSMIVRIQPLCARWPG